ncbi:hypothetical protein GEMRC1_013098 [Eukaryota sp. GEM-RC1]
MSFLSVVPDFSLNVKPILQQIIESLRADDLLAEISAPDFKNSISRDYPFISLVAYRTDGINTLLLSTTCVVLVINISGCKIPESLRSILLQPNITKVFNGELNHFEKLQQQFSISLTDSFDIAPYFRFTRKVLSRKTSIGNDSFDSLSGVIPVFKAHGFTPINPTNDPENQLFESTISVFCIALTYYRKCLKKISQFPQPPQLSCIFLSSPTTLISPSSRSFPFLDIHIFSSSPSSWITNVHPYCCDLHDSDAILSAESKALTPSDHLSEYLPLFARLLFVILSDASNAEIMSVISSSAPQIIVTSCLSYLITAVQSLGERAQVDVLRSMIALKNVESYPLYFFTLAANLLSGYVNFDSEKVDKIKKLSFDRSFILAAKTDDFSRIEVFKNMNVSIKNQFFRKTPINSFQKTNKPATRIESKSVFKLPQMTTITSRSSFSLDFQFLKWVVTLLGRCSWSTVTGIFKLFKLVLLFLGRCFWSTFKGVFQISKIVLVFLGRCCRSTFKGIFCSFKFVLFFLGKCGWLLLRGLTTITMMRLRQLIKVIEGHYTKRNPTSTDSNHSPNQSSLYSLRPNDSGNNQSNTQLSSKGETQRLGVADVVRAVENNPHYWSDLPKATKTQCCNTCGSVKITPHPRNVLKTVVAKNLCGVLKLISTDAFCVAHSGGKFPKSNSISLDEDKLEALFDDEELMSTLYPRSRIPETPEQFKNELMEGIVSVLKYIESRGSPPLFFGCVLFKQFHYQWKDEPSIGLKRGYLKAILRFSGNAARRNYV